MQSKLTISAILVTVLLVGSAIIVSNSGTSTNTSSGSTVRSDAGTTNKVGTAVMENGVQYIDITARGGYTPRVTKATAGVPTMIRMKTNNTYDCSTALVIPDLKYQTYLKPTDMLEVEIPVEKTQGTLRGMCSMAMYHFQIDFE